MARAIRIPPRWLRELWAEVPDMVGCTGQCWNSCGPIDCSSVERKLIEDRAGKTLKAEGRGLVCSMLKDGRCTVYSIRPLICRIWGVVESMPCPHGCKPERELTDREAFGLMLKAAELSGDPEDRNIFQAAIDNMGPVEWEAFRRYVSNSVDLGNKPLERAEAAQDLIEAVRRRGGRV